MNRYLSLLPFLLVLLLIHACKNEPGKNTSEPVKIIFDTDFGADADDLGALVMLHNLDKKGECDLLAVMCWQTEVSAVSGIDAVNRFYKNPVPIGTRKDATHINDWNHAQVIAAVLNHQLNHDSAEDAVTLYRKILAGSEDKSIKIIVVGPLKNIQNLLLSPGDSLSPLTGKELIHQKVAEFAIMGGQYPEGEKEWNFDGNMPGVTKFVIENIDVPMVFSGYEVGFAIKTGAVFNQLDDRHPLKIGFAYFSEHAPWIKEHFKGEILDNASYDQTAVLYAVRGEAGRLWDVVSGGYCLPDSIGGNQWIEGDKTNHSYLKLIAPPEKAADDIELIMLDKF